MNHFTSTDNARPWWDDVAHLRDDAPAPAGRPVDRPTTGTLELRAEHTPRESRGHASASAPRRRGRASESARPSSDWFADEARGAGRRKTPRVDPRKPVRPRATLVDVAPHHAAHRRAQQVRRNPGERPTVTITGRPEAALPPQPVAQRPAKGRRTREHAYSLVASPDRMILWAVALGLLMILASIGTASADAASTTLTLVR